MYTAISEPESAVAVQASPSAPVGGDTTNNFELRSKGEDVRPGEMRAAVMSGASPDPVPPVLLVAGGRVVGRVVGRGVDDVEPVLDVSSHRMVIPVVLWKRGKKR